jgi:predicted porin
MYWNNGDRSDTYIVDAATESSRFGLIGEAKISSSLKAGYNIEVSALSAQSDKVTEEDDDGTNGAITGIGTADGAVLVRLAYWYLQDSNLGKLSVGRLKMASDGVTEIDLSGTGVIAKSGLYYGNDLGVGGLAGTNFDTFALGNFEFDRNNAVKYETPTFGGFQGAAAWGENDRWDIALRYAGEMSGFRIAAGIAYSRDTEDGSNTGETAADATIVSGSVSVLHVASGLFVTGAAANRHNEITPIHTDDFYWHVRGGITKNWLGVGNTALYAEYHNWDNESVVGDASIWGLGIVQNIDAAAMQLFLAYKNHSVDLPNTDDTNLVIGGARIQF